MRLRGRGIVLIGILVLTVLATFFLGALMQMNPTRLRRTVQDERHDDAMAAARAGVEYALAKLVEDRDWRALANTTTIETDNLIVLEDQGNVLGWIRTEGGAWSGFRLRFNYQDGDGGEDGLQQPTRVIPTEAISYNNLEGASPFPVPLGTGSGFAYTGQTGFLVPEHSVALLVEGFTSPGLQPQVDAGPRYDEGRGESIVRRLEGIYQVVGFSGGHADGAVLQAGGNSHFLLGSGATGVGHPDDFQGFLRLTASAQTATMRTKGAATINTAPNKSSLFNFYPDMNSVVRSGSPTFSPRTKAGQTFSSDDEPSDAVLMDIAWDKVAVSEQEDRLFLPAGVYAIADGDTDSSDTDRVKYFPMSFPEYRRSLVSGETPASAPVPPEFLKMVELNGEAWKTPEGGTERRDVITFEKDVEVTAVGTTKDLAIIPLGGARQQSVANQVIAPSSTEFAGLNPTLQAATGTAIMGYLGGGLTDGSGGTGTTVLPGYSPVELAVAALSGTPIALSGASDPTFQPPGTERIAGNQIAVIDPGVFLAAVDQVRALPGGLLEFQADALEVPTDVVRDNTEPQDIELRFRPAPGQSAAIRSEGNVFLAAHSVGKGGAVVAGGKIDAVGLGVDLEASQGEREGFSLYSKKGINISTFDRKRNKFWDASIKGVVFTRGNLNMRLGEVVSPGSTSEPTWGRFDLRGAIVALGEARGQAGLPTEISSHGGGEQQDADGLTGEGESGGAAWDPTSHQRSQGNVSMVAGGVRLFYEPKFLAPHLGEMVSLPIFAPLSIAER